MATKLVILESPNKTKAVKGYLGKNYKVIASQGHVRDLPKSTLGIDIENDFSTYWVNIQSRYKNIMHEKFCVVDLQTVIHGTFNWTKAASYNKEHISIDCNRETAESFADEFMKLKSISRKEIDSFDFDEI